MALDSNLSVRAGTYYVDVQRALKGASWDIPKISVDGQFGQINSYASDNGFTVTQSFAFPTVYVNQNKLADASVKSSELQLKSSRIEIATRVKQVYWQLTYLNSKYKLWLYQDSLYSGFKRAAELRARAGETNKLEMITASSQSLEIKNQLQQIKADIGIFNRQLQTLLNTGFAIYPADTVLFRIGYVPAFDSTALNENPELEQFKQQVEIVRLEKKLEQSRAMPDFNIGYFSQTMQGTQDVNGVPRTFGAADRFTGVHAGISVPLWFSPYTSKVRAAKVKEQVAIANEGYYTNNLKGKYQSLLDEFEKYRESVEYYEKQAVPEAGMIIDQSARSYKAGALDYLDYVLSLGRALSIKQNYLDALNNFNQTIINIEFITGKIY
jgi:cobalt-zinc-cadmium resistance protein CzcA